MHRAPLLNLRRQHPLDPTVFRALALMRKCGVPCILALISSQPVLGVVKCEHLLLACKIKVVERLHVFHYSYTRLPLRDAAPCPC
mmetsp:Transcript_41670/g.97523  ORF Transcript_41670/g.97523 Transcript_41670/m.97523 type:complete len:85 (+) Transcript_41670:521-775(+)